MELDDHDKFDKDLVLMAKDALEARFRHLDCAEMYDNKAEVGNAIKESGIHREELFVTTKVADPWNLHTPEDYQNVWLGMEEVKASGKAKSIGVSNFVLKGLEMILKGNPKELPAEQGIQVEAFKGLTPLVCCLEGPLVGPLKRMAKAHNVSDSAVMLRWFLQQNIVAIMTTRKKERLQGYAEALTFELTKDEMDEISTEGKKLFKRFYFPELYDPDDRS
ncbi:Aldo/keto reductase subgroup [Penicillium griseofulvum]|uniref:D-xylose reductase [NAD(P)H] n=1 Tax=Penicillium patulum TaxID=5078 RepID=A0A135LIW1_PENPA|nr:Aldo/keto reductase subgroup [Penicillium griseofulvum]KXG48878.1 Aldo/keto reductase subgroup [Penicillium griseofulvum]